MATADNLFGRDDQVTVKNPTNRDFEFMWNSRRYKIKAGQEAPVPGFMAEHFVKEMTNHMMIREGKESKLMDENARKPYYELLTVKVVSMRGMDEDVDSDEVVTLGGTAPDPEAKEIARAAAPRSKAKKAKDELPEDPSPAIDEPIDLDDLPDDEAEIEKEKARLKAERGEDKPVDEDEEAFPDL